MCERYYVPVGRILVGLFFFVAGVQKFMGIDGVSGYITSVGLPMGSVLAWVAAVFLTIAGGMLVIGYQAKYAALLLAGYVLLVSFIFHGPQYWPLEQMNFMKNAAILGGLLFMAAHLKVTVPHRAPAPFSESSPNMAM